MIYQSLRLGKDEQQISLDFSEELKIYLFNKFKSKRALQPVENEIDIGFWDEFVMKITEGKIVFNELKSCYPQLTFPIESGIEKKEVYKDLVLRGKTENIGTHFSLGLNDCKYITIKIKDGIAGKIPVITVPNKDDFVIIMQCLLFKNNPKNIPHSMGAVLINGINNWQKLSKLKKDWSATNTAEKWANEFSKNILPNYSLYKDKIIVASTKPYSNVSANQLELDESLWLIYSNSIREEHEYTHLYTLKKYGIASNNLHDELIADYIGIVKTIGNYNKSWMLMFMGLESYPIYRQGARLENYIADNKLSSQDFKHLVGIIKNAIDNISLFDESLGQLQSDIDQMYRIDALCEISLEELSSINGATLLIYNYNKMFQKEV